MKGYHDYLFILSPPEDIINSVRNTKQFCAGMIGSFESLYSTAHITVQPFPRKKSFWIDPVTTKLEREFTLLPPATLQLNGFGVFTSGDNSTIYAKLLLSPAADEWFKDVRRSLQLKKFEPHITIARALPAQQFKRLWPHFGNRDWSDTFVIDRLTILQRETIGHDRSWKKYMEVPFRGNPALYRAKPPKETAVAAAAHDYGGQVRLF